MDHLLSVEMHALITTGRTGSDFFQSLCDSHSQIITFNGILWLHNFWEDSMCVKSSNMLLPDLVKEFTGKNIEKLKSKYDLFERKEALGVNKDKSVNIDIISFENHVINLLYGRDVNSKNFLLAVYGAYSLSLNQNVLNKKIVLHHIHHAEKLPLFLSDFPDSNIICMTRDPRANFLSGVTHWRKYNNKFDHAHHLYNYLKRIVMDSYSIRHYNNDYIVIRLEDLGKKCTLESFCEWAKIKYEDSLMKSTWAGLLWQGDRCSAKKNEGSGWSANMLDNKWQIKLTFIDKYLINFLLNSRLKHYGYDYTKIRLIDYLIVPLLIPLPLSLEARYFSLSYFSKSIKSKDYSKLLKAFVFYPKRVAYFYAIYIDILRGFNFDSNFLKCK